MMIPESNPESLPPTNWCGHVLCTVCNRYHPKNSNFNDVCSDCRRNARMLSARKRFMHPIQKQSKAHNLPQLTSKQIMARYNKYNCILQSLDPARYISIRDISFTDPYLVGRSKRKYLKILCDTGYVQKNGTGRWSTYRKLKNTWNEDVKHEK